MSTLIGLRQFSVFPEKLRADRFLLIVLILLVSMGYVMMGSASMEFASQKYGDPWYHIVRQGVFLLLGFAVLIATVYVPLQQWQRASSFLLIVAYLLLVLVLLVGAKINGSQRWIPLGPVNFQASEIAKLFVVLYMAAYLVRREDVVRQYWGGFMRPLSVLAAMIVLLLLEPDFGAVVVMVTASLGMLYLAGVRLGQFFLVIVVCLAAIIMMALLSPYRLQRLTTFVDPWPHQFDSGYQLVQSLIAFGRGEWFGLGLGRSVQKLFYLPEAHTDFVFAIVGEELGFAGALAVLLLIGLLVWRILQLGHRAERLGHKFAAYVCYGIAIIFAVQSFINIGVNAGLLPTKGLTLPFFSYGGSSVLVSFMMVGLALRAHYEMQPEQLKKASEAVKPKRNRNRVTGRAMSQQPVGKASSTRNSSSRSSSKKRVTAI